MCDAFRRRGLELFEIFKRDRIRIIRHQAKKSIVSSSNGLSDRDPHSNKCSAKNDGGKRKNGG